MHILGVGTVLQPPFEPIFEPKLESMNKPTDGSELEPIFESTPTG